MERPDLILAATGSEVGLCLEAAEKLAGENLAVRVVSMPCWELFEAQSDEYKESVFPSAVKARVGVEAGVDLGWYKWIGDAGEFVGMSNFGASAPAAKLMEHFGFTVDNVVAKAKASIAACK